MIAAMVTRNPKIEINLSVIEIVLALADGGA
jgi:hypothetical protein